MSTRHGPFSDASVGDLYVYGSYKDLMAHGLVPYRDFVFEYPPGALIRSGWPAGMSTTCR